MGRIRRGARAALLGVGLTVAAAACMHPQSDVAYVQTPDDIAAHMLRLAAVKPSDVVYDLGSGDGRIPIMAARQFEARGVGIEIEPRLVAESRETAKKLKVDDRVEFIQRSFFEVDVSPATVVTLYLGNELNLRLRPKLQKELRKGSRIVSHEFTMGDWAPEKTVTVRSKDKEHRLFLWTVR
jgi:ubiquinone/menaquinone biosynthesis C-methylase UbiE